MRRKTRLILLSILITIVVVLLIASITVYSLLQPKRITDMLRAQARDAGMALVLGSPAEPTLWPQPALVLHSITLSSSNRPVLVAARARVVLPWSTLLGGPTTITRLELDAPRLHLDQLSRVLMNNDRAESGGNLTTLPNVKNGVRISHGSVVHNGELMLDDLYLQTGPLHPGRVFNLLLTAKAYGAPFKLTLLTTPHSRADKLELDNIHLTIDTGDSTGLVLNGHAMWNNDHRFDLSLEGTLKRKGDRSYKTVLDMVSTPRPGQPSTLHLVVDGPGLNADLDLPPAALTDWWQEVSRLDGSASLPLPPLDGTLDIQELHVGDTRIEGLHLSSGNSAAPASASSTPAPATTPATP